jgi:Metallo-beta-lactamase superfamily
MKKRRTLAWLAISLLMATGGAGPKQVRAAPKAEDDFQLIKVADGVYAAIAKPGGLASGNAGFVIGDEGVVIFDTFFTPAALEELIGEIQALTKLPIMFAVNSHYHLDHTGGNQVLTALGVPIIAHDNVMKWQTTKNKRFLPASADLQKRRADAAKQLGDTPADQKDKRTQLERQISRYDALAAIKLTNPTATFSSGIVRL